MHDAGLCAVTQGQKEGGDAVCPPQTHLEARSAAAEGPKRCERRVPDGCGRSKLATNGQVARSEGRKRKPDTCMKVRGRPRTHQVSSAFAPSSAKTALATGAKKSFSTQLTQSRHHREQAR